MKFIAPTLKVTNYHNSTVYAYSMLEPNPVRVVISSLPGSPTKISRIYIHANGALQGEVSFPSYCNMPERMESLINRNMVGKCREWTLSAYHYHLNSVKFKNTKQGSTTIVDESLLSKLGRLIEELHAVTIHPKKSTSEYKDDEQQLMCRIVSIGDHTNISLYKLPHELIYQEEFSYANFDSIVSSVKEDLDGKECEFVVDCLKDKMESHHE